MTATPGPTALQILRQARNIQRNPLDFLLDCARSYGPLVQFRVGRAPAYALSEPEHIKHILQDNARNYSKDTLQFSSLKLVTGEGLATSEGELWLRQRRLMQPIFHRGSIAAFGAQMTEATERMLARWDALPDGTVLDVDAEMMKVTLEIVGRTLFSVDLSREADALVRAVLAALDFVIYRAQTPWAWPLALPTPRNRGFRAALAVLDAAIAALLAKRRTHADPPHDLLTMLMEAKTESGEGMSEKQLRDEILTLLIAGHETTASALTWSWHLLAQHPEAAAVLQSELAAVLGGRPPTMDDLPRLPYTRAVFDEAMRLYPPVWLITRQAIAPDIVGGQAMPANSLIIISPYVVHRRADLWPEADSFSPERFLAPAERPRFAYLPFGGGPRLCIGQSFALAEGALVLATVAQRYCLTTAAGQSVHAEALVTLRPKGGLPMMLQRRS